MSIYKKLLELQKGVVGLQKDAQGNAAAYLTGNKLLSVVRPLMDSLGLLLLPEVLEATFTPNEFKTSKGDKKEYFCALKMRFKWVDTESGETLEQLWASSGQTGFDKSLGSALTYGERYYLMKMLHLQTDRDDVDAPKSAEEELNDLNWESYINSLQSVQDLDAMWAQYGAQLKGNRAVIAAFNKRKKALTNGTA